MLLDVRTFRPVDEHAKAKLPAAWLESASVERRGKSSRGCGSSSCHDPSFSSWSDWSPIRVALLVGVTSCVVSSPLLYALFDLVRALLVRLQCECAERVSDLFFVYGAVGGVHKMVSEGEDLRKAREQMVRLTRVENLDHRAARTGEDQIRHA